MEKWKKNLCCLLSGCFVVLSGAESYSDLMDRAEKLTIQRYDKTSRAFKIKSAELDAIFESRESTQEKIRRLKTYISELESSLKNADRSLVPADAVPEQKNTPAAVPPKAAADSDPVYERGMDCFLGRGRAVDYAEAMRLFREAAARGSVRGAAMVGRMYYEGKGTPVNYVEAFKWLKNAADSDPEALSLLGCMYYKSLGVPRNYAEAYRCFRKVIAEKPSDSTALYALGCMYLEGNGVKQDSAAARACFEKIADRSADAMFMLGMTAPDRPQAIQWFQRAYEHGSGNAAFQLGRLHEQSADDPDSRKKAERYYRVALENGVEDAKQALAVLYSRHPQTLTPKQHREAVLWLQPLADKGDAFIMLRLADLHMRNKPAEALKYLGKAAETGNAEALYRLGMAYWEGRITTRSYGAAFKCFKLAHEQGNAEASFMLARHYMEGKGTTVNFRLAADLLQQLYSGGCVRAGIPLGIMYYEGQGVQKNYARARDCLLKGLSAPGEIPGDFRPYALLGKMYYLGGGGLEKNLPEARKYLQKAGNDPEALYLLGCLQRDGRGGLTADDRKAFALFSRAAALGDMLAKAEAGKMYCTGRGVEKNYALAVQYLKLAADRGDQEAARMLAGLYADVKNPKHDDAAAFRYFQGLAQTGDADALYRCGMMLLEGRGTAKDEPAGFRYLREAAKHGHAEAAFRCGEQECREGRQDKGAEFFRMAAEKKLPEAMRRYADWILPRDPAAGIQLLKELAEQGDPAALEQMADLTGKGIGKMPPNPEQSEKYYRMAAEKGSVKAQARLAEICFGKKDYAQAAKYAALAAAKDDMDASALLGKMYCEGKGVKQDRVEALRYLKKPAEQGIAYAVNMTGRLLYNAGHYAEAEKYLSKTAGNDPEILFMRGRIRYLGTDGSPDYAGAFELLSAAAGAGHTGAMCLIGRMYHRGEGLPQDFSKALQWYRQAAGKGDADAMYHVGNMYYNGDGVSPDYLEALRWFKQAAEKGNVVAMQYVSIMYKEGIGVRKNNVEAAKWRKMIQKSRQ